MAESSQTEPPQKGPKELEAALDLLKKPDDTSRFAGLAVLKPVLEYRLSQSDDSDPMSKSALIRRCWRAVPSNFLTRLLNVRPNDKRSNEDAQNMVALAVAVINAFYRLLEAPDSDKKFLAQVHLLLQALKQCTPEAAEQILEIVHSFVMTPNGPKTIFSLGRKHTSEDMPTNYLFLTMLIIDVRATLPSLQESLHTPGYTSISARLTRAYDIIAAFIGYLSNLPIEDDETPSIETLTSMSAELLLNLRGSISAVISLTFKYLRERFDSSKAGAKEYGTLNCSKINSPSDPLLQSWAKFHGIFEDQLTIAQIRTVGLWLMEEDNQSLKAESAGLMDFYIAAYQWKPLFNHYRAPLVHVFLSTLPIGIDNFLREDGWNILFKDLSDIANTRTGCDYYQGTRIVTLLGLMRYEHREWEERLTKLISLIETCLDPEQHEDHHRLGADVAECALDFIDLSLSESKDEDLKRVESILERTIKGWIGSYKSSSKVESKLKSLVQRIEGTISKP